MLILAVKPTYIIFIVALIFIIQVIAALRCYKRCGPGEALVRTGLGGARVVFDHGLVIIPVMHKVTIVSLAAKQLEFTAKIVTKDAVHKELNCNIIVRINKTPEDVCNALTVLGAERLTDDNKLLKLFEPKYSEYIQVVAKGFTLEEIENRSFEFKESVLNLIGTDVNTLSLEDMTLTVS